MESNKDEAIRCLAIAQKHRDAGNLPSARKFCQKSINLFSTPEAQRLLDSIDATASSSDSGSGSGPSTSSSSAGGFTSSAETHPSASGVKNRHASSSSANGTAGGMGGEKRDFTPDQLAVVKRVRACKVTEYYEILAVKRDCEEAEIKEAYRKLALALHPDKNGAPGADEAFKMVSKAFQILSDPQKRTVFDQSGADPESRSSGMSAGRSPGFATSQFGGGFEGELSPEDLFNMFFGGGLNAGGFGGFGGGPFGVGGFGNGPVFTASFGPGGFRRTRVRAGGARAAQEEPREPRSTLTQLLPLIILLAFSFLSALPSLFSTDIPDPRFSFSATSRYNVERHTSGLGVKYHVNAAEFSNHPHIAAELAARDAGRSTRGNSALNQFEGTVERVYTQDLYSQCQRGLERKERRKEAEVGFLGIGTDWEKVKKIEQEPIESCEELRRLGVLKS